MNRYNIPRYFAVGLLDDSVRQIAPPPVGTTDMEQSQSSISETFHVFSAKLKYFWDSNVGCRGRRLAHTLRAVIRYPPHGTVYRTVLHLFVRQSNSELNSLRKHDFFKDTCNPCVENLPDNHLFHSLELRTQSSANEKKVITESQFCS